MRFPQLSAIALPRVSPARLSEGGCAAFGGVIIINRPVTKTLAEQMVADKKFFEILAAPVFEKQALEIFAQRPKLQLLQNPNLKKPFLNKYLDVKKIRGGFFMQDIDAAELSKK